MRRSAASAKKMTGVSKGLFEAGIFPSVKCVCASRLTERGWVQLACYAGETPRPEVRFALFGGEQSVAVQYVA